MLLIFFHNLNIEITVVENKNIECQKVAPLGAPNGLKIQYYHMQTVKLDYIYLCIYIHHLAISITDIFASSQYNKHSIKLHINN